MIRKNSCALIAVMLLFACMSMAKPILNVYLVGGEIPPKLIWDFQKETGIQVNVSTYDNNETMYAKLRANKKNIYDIILPSSYYVERLKKYGLITKIDASLLKNAHNIDPSFTNNPFDPHNDYHIPLVWGITGIFYNQKWIPNPPTSWGDLWDKKWANQLMLNNDARDLFSIGLMSLGYDVNDTNPEHIKAAYEHLLELVPNIKLFANDAIRSLIIDEDAHVGAVWNGEVVKAQDENKAIRFVYPTDGFVIWVDCIAIPKSAPHLKEAYQFIDYLLRPSSGAQIVLEYGYAIANQASLRTLPKSIRDNPTIFPPKNVMSRGHYQRNIDEKTLQVYSEYWEKLKLAF
jgi:spermidine/putrescine transport system substrate-binding protein